MDPSIFRPEITYGMLRIVTYVFGSRVCTFLRSELRKNRPPPVKLKNHRNEVKFHDQIIDSTRVKAHSKLWFSLVCNFI